MFPELPPRIYESLKALCCLAVADKPMRAHEIAAAAALPPAQTAKILQQMTWAGFVESRRGIKGGFWLLKAPARIRVTDVVTFFAHRTASRRLKDPVLQALAQATKRCRKELDRITISDLVKLSASKRGSKHRRKT
jgi:Rrf2 family protein